jgi:hypothetical protein
MVYLLFDIRFLMVYVDPGFEAVLLVMHQIAKFGGLQEQPVVRVGRCFDFR